MLCVVSLSLPQGYIPDLWVKILNLYLMNFSEQSRHMLRVFRTKFTWESNGLYVKPMNTYPAMAVKWRENTMGKQYVGCVLTISVPLMSPRQNIIEIPLLGIP